MRSLLVIFASVSGYFIVYEIAGNTLAYIGLVSGLLISVLALLFEDRVKRTPLRIVIGGAIGLIIGLVVANLLTYPVMLNFKSRYIELAAYLITNIIIGYIGLSIGMKKGDEFDSEWFAKLFTGHQKDGEPQQAKPQVLQPLVVDTNVLIDGRIA